MRSIPVAAVLLLSCLAVPRLGAAEEGRFERTLSVGAPASVSVQSGSGDVVVRRGANGTILVRGRISAKGSWLADQDATALIRRLEQQPPIVQQGNTVAIGRIEDEELERRLEVSYDVTVPEATDLQVKSGSGDVLVEGVARSVSITSGSGSVVASRLGGSTDVTTGSGDVKLDGDGGDLKARSGSGDLSAAGVGGAATVQTASGEVRLDVTGRGHVDASSSSGDVRVSGARGTVTAQSSSGDIALDGVPGGAWSLRSSSGDISVRLGEGAGFTLDAQTSSGRIQSAAPVTTTGAMSGKALKGDVRGGGPRLELRTASGNIDVR